MRLFADGGKPTVQEAIVLVLADEFPLSINELKSRIKQRYGLAVSYQAVHKETQQLIEGGVLQREERAFLLNMGWLLKNVEFYQRAETNVSHRRLVTHVSFDLNETLSPEQFDKMVWNEKIPKLYARKNRLTIAAAKQRVYAEYYKARYIEKVPNWTDIQMWFDRLGLDDWRGLLDEVRREVTVYDDVHETLQALSKRYRLVIIARSELKLIELKLEAAGIRKYFSHIISTVTTLRIPEKTPAAYEKTLERLRIRPEQIVHVGDDAKLDYEAPAAVGIRSFILDRSGTVDGPHIIHSLRDLGKHL